MMSELFDVVIVGAGFSGINCLYELRKEGFSCKVFEAGPAIGGVWNWNCYPGARTDSNYILYQFQQDEISGDFPWSEKFSGWAELHDYFSFVDERQNFSRHIQYNTRVTAASFDAANHEWEITTSDLVTTRCRHFVLCTGFASKAYRPKYKGMEKFQGQCFHTGDWKVDREVDFKNKRVAVIGTGPSGVQVIQEVSPIVERLTVFQRTPNLAVPMRQKKRGEDWPFAGQAEYPTVRAQFMTEQFTALPIGPQNRNCADPCAEKRLEFFEKLYAQGGFDFWRANYDDIWYNLEANKYVYDFWREKTAPRIQDPIKRAILVPAVPPHPFAVKRPSLEQAYFEVYNQSNVDLVDLRKNEIAEITEHGILLDNGDEVKVDFIVLATGFDAVTGSLFEIDIKNGSGEKLKDQWDNKIETLVGLATPGFPNMWFVNGPQGTVALSSVCVAGQQQCEWLAQLMTFMNKSGKLSVEPKKEACEEWTAHVQEVWHSSLYRLANSWYGGGNIPGKKKQPLSYIGGNPTYMQHLQNASADGYSSFIFQ